MLQIRVRMISYDIAFDNKNRALLRIWKLRAIRLEPAFSVSGPEMSPTYNSARALLSESVTDFLIAPFSVISTKFTSVAIN